MEGEYSSIPTTLTQPLVENLEAYFDNKSSLQESNTSSFKTLFNFANVLLGNGVLVMPYVLASGGWFSLLLFITISASATYTGLLVKRCMEANPRIKTYAHIGEYAFGNNVT